MQLIPFSIETVIDNAPVLLVPTLLICKDKLYLVDCGYEESAEALAAALRQRTIDLQQLAGVIISHDDHDHLGGLHLLKKQNSQLQIICGAIEKNAVEGTVPSERLLQAEASLPHLPAEYKDWAQRFIVQLKQVVRVPVTTVLNDGDLFEEELLVIHTPGHTKGHLSFFHTASRTCIAADALIVTEEGFDIANPAFTLDLPEALRSVKKIQQFGPEKIICYHGGVVQDAVNEKLDALLERYKHVLL